MAKITIEYRHGKPKGLKDSRRDVVGMRHYTEDLINEMLSAGIHAEYIDGVALDGEKNTLIINGKDILHILNGLNLVPLEGDDCGIHKENFVKFGRPDSDWKRDIIEDIPDVMVKNAIAKAYADMNAGRTL